MHVHAQDTTGVLALATGVTTVRDLGNDIDELGARVARIEAGTELGPTILRAGVIDGKGPLAAPTGILADTPEEARAAVKRYADLGFLQIKIYSSVKPALVPVIAAAAHERGLRVSGHVPFGLRASEAVAAGFDELQHVNFLFLQFLAGPGDDTRTPLRYVRVAERGATLDLAGPDVRAFLDLLATRGTVIDPTLATFEGLFKSDPGQLDPMAAPLAGRLPAQVERGARGGGLAAPAAQRDLPRLVRRDAAHGAARVRAQHPGGRRHRRRRARVPARARAVRAGRHPRARGARARHPRRRARDAPAPRGRLRIAAAKRADMVSSTAIPPATSRPFATRTS